MQASYNITTDRVVLDPEGVRLSDEQYQPVKAARFAWWPGRKIFVAKWNIQAEDIALTLAGEIAEDDTPDDVEGRVERFQKYAEEAESSADASAEYTQEATTAHRRELAANRATNEAERALYWTRRIQGAIDRATYRETPGVIARRIKGLEADERKYIKESSDKNCLQTALRRAYVSLPLEGNIPEGIVHVRVSSWKINGVEVSQMRSGYDKAKLEASKAEHKSLSLRWLEHIRLRLEYERALLAISGGLPTDGKAWEVGGAVLLRGEWQEITKINRTTFTAKSLRNKTFGGHIKWDRTEAKGLMTVTEWQAYQRGEYSPDEPK